MIRNNLTTKKEMPNYLDMIDLKPLEVGKAGGGRSDSLAQPFVVIPA